jgi:hypothetical protein
MFHLRDLAYLAVAWTLLSAHPAAVQSPSKLPDAKTIAALIAQLGSENFQERQAATRSLEAIGRPALAALREAVDKNANAEVTRRAKRLIEKIDNGLEQLLEDYKSYGLPLPPKDAPLVRFQSGGGFLLNGVKQPFEYNLGFLLKPGSKEQPPEILFGTSRIRWETSFSLLDPVKAKTAEMEGWANDARYHLLPLAIQCKSRDWEAMAAYMFQEAGRADKRLPRTQVRRIAWNYWELELSSPKCDWSVAARQLRALLRSNRELDSVPHRALVESLELALVPSKAKPGSIDALIDDLVNAQKVYVGVRSEPDPHYARLVEMGFEAVPALIEHLNDDRLTRYRSLDVMNSRGYQYRVDHVVSKLLDDLSGENLGEHGLRALKGYTAAKEKSRAWWSKAKEIGEEAHVVAGLLAEDRESPDQHLLWLMMKRHSKRLPEVYRTLLAERPKMESWSTADALAHSDLPLPKKVDLLIEATRHEKLEHREAALEQLVTLDHERFVKIFLELLDQMLKSRKSDSYPGYHSKVGYLALLTDDLRVWNELTKAVRRFDVNSRIAILQNIAWYDGSQHPKRMATFLAAFLDDTEKRTEQDWGQNLNRPEVRNHAAMDIGRLLKLEHKPEPTWDDKQWKQFREEVCEALKR